MWAGAHVRPIPVNGDAQLEREACWLKHTCQHFSRQVKAEPWCGVTALRGREYLEAPPEGYVRQTAESFAHETALPGYRQLSGRELPDGVKVGFEYDTYCVNSPLYCANLLKTFLLRGGRTVQRHLATEAEGFAVCENVKLVVNASGFGFGDPACFPTRGMFCHSNSCQFSSVHKAQLLCAKTSAHSRTNGTHQPHRNRRDHYPSKCRRNVELCHPSLLPRRHRHRRHQRAWELGPRLVANHTGTAAPSCTETTAWHSRKDRV